MRRDRTDSRVVAVETAAKPNQRLHVFSAGKTWRLDEIVTHKAAAPSCNDLGFSLISASLLCAPLYSIHCNWPQKNSTCVHVCCTYVWPSLAACNCCTLRRQNAFGGDGLAAPPPFPSAVRLVKVIDLGIWLPEQPFNYGTNKQENPFF